MAGDAFITDSDWSGGMSQDRALSVVPVFGAVRLISETISTMPLHAYARNADGTRRRIPLPAVFDSPADGSTPIAWFQRALVSMLLRGNAYGLVVTRGANGWPSGVVWLNPERVRCEVMPSGLPGYSVDGRRMPPGDIVHIPDFVLPGSFEGLSPIRAFAATFDSGKEGQEATRQWRKNRAIPGVKLKNNRQMISDEVADRMSARAQQKLQNGKPWVQGKDWDLEVISIPSSDVAFLQSIKATANEVATIYGVPPTKIGGEPGGSLTYATVEGEENALITALQSRTQKLEESLSRLLLPRPQYIKFNADSRVRVDTKTRAEVYRIWREIGLYNNDELRALEDQEPIPDGGGQSYAPLQLVTKGDPTP